MAVVRVSVFSAAMLRISGGVNNVWGLLVGLSRWTSVAKHFYCDLYLPWCEEDYMNTQIKLHQKSSSLLRVFAYDGLLDGFSSRMRHSLNFDHLFSAFYFFFHWRPTSIGLFSFRLTPRYPQLFNSLASFCKVFK